MNAKSYLAVFSLILPTAIFFAVSGCSPKEDQAVLEQRLAIQKTEMQLQLESTLQQIDTRIDSLQRRAQQVGGQTAQDINVRLDELKSLRSRVMQRLNDIDALTADTWQKFESDTQKLTDQVREKIKEVDSFLLRAA